MTRPRYQRPKVRRSGKHPEQWAARWHVYDAAGKRHERRGTFGATATTTRQEAQKACDDQVQRETSQTPPPRAGLTLAELIRDVYLPVHTRWSIQTRKAFEGTIKNHILPRLGECAIKDLNHVALQKHLIALAAAGAGESLLTRVRTILHAVLEGAVDSDYLQKNPARKLEIPACKATAPTRSLTQAEVTRLFGALEGRERLFFRLLIMTGARIGEVLALRREDVSGGVVSLCGSALFGERGPTKNRKTRAVPLSRHLQAEIEEYLAERQDSNPLVFPSQRGTILYREGWPLFALERARAAAGIADLDYRMCRRTFATLYRGEDVDVRDLLGHQSAATTQRHYIKPISERQRDAIEEMERRVSGKRAKVAEIRRAG